MKEYNLHVDEQLGCAETKHQFFRVKEWEDKAFRNYQVISFPKEAKDDELIMCCDGSVRKKVFGCGVIIRDCKLNFEESLRTVEENKRMSLILVEVEAISLAILRAIDLSSKTNIKKCYIYSDCDSAVRMYNGSIRIADKSINAILTNRKILIEKEKHKFEVEIKWMSRETNQIADKLAKKLQEVITEDRNQHP
jgi:ribonuclease HI